MALPQLWTKLKKYFVLNVFFYVFCFLAYLFTYSDVMRLITPTKIIFPDIELNKSKSSKVCRDVFEILRPNQNSTSEWVKSAVEFIRESKKLKEFLDDEAYLVLGSENMGTVHAEEPFQGINGSNITVPYESVLDKLNWELPYLPCRLKKYEAQDVKLCVDKRLALGKQTRIAYIGDSKIRQQMEVFLDLLQPFNLNISTSEGDYLSLDEFLGEKGSSHWAKYKDRLNVTSEDLPGLFIKFIWAPNLSKDNEEYSGSNPYTLRSRRKPKRRSFTRGRLPHDEKYRQNYEVGAFNVLKYMASRSQEELDDLILLGGGSWQLHSHENILDNIDIKAVHGMQKIYPFLESLAAKTSVVMMLPEPFKEYIFNFKNGAFNYYFHQKNVNLEWYRNAQSQILPSNVQIWDSFIPVSYSGINDCVELLLNPQINISALPQYSRFEAKSSYGCSERIHLGFRNIYTSVQQLLNHLCNNVMIEEKNQNFCCSE